MKRAENIARAVAFALGISVLYLVACAETWFGLQLWPDDTSPID